MTRAAGFVGTWIVLAATYLLLVDTVSTPELITGAVVATIAAIGSELVRLERRLHTRIPLRGLALAWKPVARAPTDLVLVLLAIVRQVFERKRARGRIRAMPFRHGGDAPDAAGRRALAESLGSFAPNTIVIGVDDERNLIIVHQLVPTGETAKTLDPMELR
jgi:multisubunit Na+/H+ antiporter MnhE subunit